jgi:toxin CcdB
MAQYDVFTNPSKSADDGIPYVVVIQSDLLDALATRMTVPLAVFDEQIKAPNALCPVVTVKGKRFHALAHYAAPLPAKALKRPLANVESQADMLVSAIDTVISGI